MSETKDKGDMVEALVQAEFIRRGFTVLRPFGENNRYDLVVDVGGDFLRIQCKHAPYKHGCIKCDFRIGTIPNGNKYETYREGEIDGYAIYCKELDELYWIPFEDAPKTSMSLRVDDSKGTGKNTNWAKEYKFDNFQ